MKRAAGLQLDMDLARSLSSAQIRAALAPVFALTGQRHEVSLG